MNIGPDAISIGPLVLGWSRLSLVLGLLVFLGLVSRRKDARLDSVAWQAVLLGLIAARMGYGLLNISTLAQGGIGEWLGSLVDIRKGGLWWPVGVGAGLLWAGWRLRSQTSRLIGPCLIAVAVALLPMLLRPVSVPNLNISSQSAFTGIKADGPQTTLTWAELPKPVLVNVWASWCGPCRSEMPLLDEYARQGYPIFFLNSGEAAGTVQNYLKGEGLSLTAYLDQPGLANQLGVRGLPTTLIFDSTGKLITRHMGPLDRVQLLRMLGLVGQGKE